ncbi:hypothetical protein ACFYRN_43765 [Streptomyces sp. NPDC005227]|uniref:hypothetical protein n=1 Tax=Streptomyces sp. NPDC005227 TaxID=3364707 RepID=UPI0036BBD2F4
MDAQSHNAALAELRAVRDEIKRTRAALAKLEADRDQRIVHLAAYGKAKAERIAPAAGLSVADIVTLAPALAPESLTAPATAPATTAPLLESDAPQSGPRPADAAPEPAPQAATAAPSTSASGDQTPDAELPAVDGTPGEPVPVRPAALDAPRELPSIPEGTAGDGWFSHTPKLVSQHPNFTQQARSTIFLDTDTGVLVHRQQTHHLDLADASVAAILNAVFHVLPEGVERIYITGGDPWHQDADRYPYLRDAVAAWLNAPTPGWRTDTGRGRDRMAGHFVHARNPVGRYQRDNADQHVEIRSVGEWFDVDGADPATVRDAFVLLWQALRRHWDDAVIMGSPSQTGRDLWTRGPAPSPSEASTPTVSPSSRKDCAACSTPPRARAAMYSSLLHALPQTSEASLKSRPTIGRAATKIKTSKRSSKESAVRFTRAALSVLALLITQTGTAHAVPAEPDRITGPGDTIVMPLRDALKALPLQDERALLRALSTRQTGRPPPGSGQNQAVDNARPRSGTRLPAAFTLRPHDRRSGARLAHRTGRIPSC